MSIEEFGSDLDMNLAVALGALREACHQLDQIEPELEDHALADRIAAVSVDICIVGEAISRVASLTGYRCTDELEKKSYDDYIQRVELLLDRVAKVFEEEL